MVIYEQKEVLVDCLTTRLTDPRGRLSSNTDTQTATAGQTEFTVVTTTGKKFYSITSLTVDSVSKDKWKDYYIDSQNQKVILKTGASLNDSVVITFKEGSTSWIYKDKPREDLSLSSYPRISTLIISGPGTRAGNYKADIENNIHFQIDIWTKEDIGDNSQIFTINGRKYEGDKLAQVIGVQICRVFKDYEDDMYPQLYDAQIITSPRDLPMEDKHQAFHTIVEVEFKTIGLGENI